MCPHYCCVPHDEQLKAISRETAWTLVLSIAGHLEAIGMRARTARYKDGVAIGPLYADDRGVGRADG